MISSFPVSCCRWNKGAVISSFSAEVTAPSPSPPRYVTSTPESSGESYGTITRTAKRMPSTHLAPVAPSGVELVSRATYISRNKRNRETIWRQSKVLKRVQREAKHKLVAQPEISHEVAEAILRKQQLQTDEKLHGVIHVSHQLALLHGHENVFFCTQSGAANAGGSLRLLKSLCDGSGEFRQKARRKLVRGLKTNMLWQMRSAGFKCAQFFLGGAGCSDLSRIVNLIRHRKLLLNRWKMME